MMTAIPTIILNLYVAEKRLFLFFSVEFGLNLLCSIFKRKLGIIGG